MFLQKSLTEQYGKERRGGRGKTDQKHGGVLRVDKPIGDGDTHQEGGNQAVDQRKQGMPAAAEKRVDAKDEAYQHAVQTVGTQV